MIRVLKRPVEKFVYPVALAMRCGHRSDSKWEEDQRLNLGLDLQGSIESASCFIGKKRSFGP